MAIVNIHSSLLRFTNHQSQLHLAIDRTSNILAVLCAHYEKLSANILDSNKELTPFVNIYVNGKNLNQLPDQDVLDTDQIDILTALVGG